MFQSKTTVQNSSQTPRVVYVEPWGGDYTLLPGEELTIEAFGSKALPWFQTVLWPEDTQVYCENTDDFRVTQGNTEIKCGHNRQPGSSAWPPLDSSGST